MIRLSLTVADIDTLIAQSYTQIKVYTDPAADGDFSTLNGTVTLVAETTGYTYVDITGTSATYYKTSYYGLTSGEGTKSDAVQGGVVSPYCTAIDIRKELATSTDEAAIGEEFDSVIWEMCISASDLIDKEKRVQPNAYRAITSEARYFYGSGNVQQIIDDCVSISEVAVEESDGTYTVWGDDDYFTWPDNYGSWEEPIRRLEINLKSAGSKSAFTRGQRRIKVTAVWGVSASPFSVVKRACIVQCARWYKRAQQAWQDASANIATGELIFVQELDPAIARMLRSVYPTKRAGI